MHPWTLPEYLLLLSIKPLGSKNDDIKWNEVASKLNTNTRYPQRSTWDCWHRWAVPWCRSQHPSKPRRNTYPHAPGVQHEYKFADLEGLIELWAPVSGEMGISHGVISETMHAFPAPKTPAVQPRRAWGRAHHPGAHSAPLILCACSLWVHESVSTAFGTPECALTYSGRRLRARASSVVHHWCSQHACTATRA
jgi:hypothetical protein